MSIIKKLKKSLKFIVHVYKITSFYDKIFCILNCKEVFSFWKGPISCNMKGMQLIKQSQSFLKNKLDIQITREVIPVTISYFPLIKYFTLLMAALGKAALRNISYLFSCSSVKFDTSTLQQIKVKCHLKWEVMFLLSNKKHNKSD